MIQGGGPAVTAALAMLFLRERLPGRALLGIGLSCLGIAGIVVGSLGGGGEATQPLLGNLLTAASAVSWAAYTVLGRRVAAYPPLRLTAVASAIGTALLAPFALAELLTTGIGAPTPATWLAVAYLGIGPSGAAYLLWTRGVRAVPASEAGVFLNLIPVLGLGLAAIILSERPGPVALLGGAVVLAGVWLTTRPTRGLTTKGTKMFTR